MREREITICVVCEYMDDLETARGYWEMLIKGIIILPLTSRRQNRKSNAYFLIERSKEAQWWLMYIEMERRNGQIHKCRSLFKRAANTTHDGGDFRERCVVYVS